MVYQNTSGAASYVSQHIADAVVKIYIMAKTQPLRNLHVYLQDDEYPSDVMVQVLVDSGLHYNQFRGQIGESELFKHAEPNNKDWHRLMPSTLGGNGNFYEQIDDYISMALVSPWHPIAMNWVRNGHVTIFHGEIRIHCNRLTEAIWDDCASLAHIIPFGVTDKWRVITALIRRRNNKKPSVGWTNTLLNPLYFALNDEYNFRSLDEDDVHCMINMIGDVQYSLQQFDTIKHAGPYKRVLDLQGDRLYALRTGALACYNQATHKVAMKSKYRVVGMCGPFYHEMTQTIIDEYWSRNKTQPYFYEYGPDLRCIKYRRKFLQALIRAFYGGMFRCKAPALTAFMELDYELQKSLCGRVFDLKI